jgi:very-short-patch-repair endonuclease
LKVIRFENKQLYDNLEGVLDTIKQALQQGHAGCE